MNIRDLLVEYFTSHGIDFKRLNATPRFDQWQAEIKNVIIIDGAVSLDVYVYNNDAGSIDTAYRVARLIGALNVRKMQIVTHAAGWSITVD